MVNFLEHADMNKKEKAGATSSAAPRITIKQTQPDTSNGAGLTQCLWKEHSGGLQPPPLIFLILISTCLGDNAGVYLSWPYLPYPNHGLMIKTISTQAA